MLIKLSKTNDLFGLEVGQKVAKGNLFDLIQYSKQDGSEHWSGQSYRIGNTPQQGINWVGEFPDLHGVIIKSKSKWYDGDGWQDAKHNLFRYSFKAVKGQINREEKANKSLISQPDHGYPILLFLDTDGEYEFNGAFSISEVGEKSVLLNRMEGKAFRTPWTDRKRLQGGYNAIYYGAPGTGKSWTIDQLVKVSKSPTFRTVFHPDMQNSDFVGTLKPVIVEDHVSYAFSPGPFGKAYVAAIKNPRQMTWLVIEELNRAPAAAVFGELFLLLDRNDDGSGVYDVDCPSEEFGKWIAAQTGDLSGKLRLPSNLSIVCTMNSADLGVYPLDTAFRRRWRQHYIPLDYEDGPNTNLAVVLNSGSITLTWLEFVKRLNALLSENGIAEDRLIGPWFVKPGEFHEKGLIPEKLLVYLWDDLLRSHGRDIIFRDGHINTYGTLLRFRNESKPFLSVNLEGRLG